MTWADVVTALSTGIIALVVLALGFTLLVALRETRRLQQSVERLVDVLDREARPTLQSARAMVDDVSRVVSAVRVEADSVVGATKETRERLNRLVLRVEERLQDLDALVDVLQYEVEETALDVAAALRTTRRGASVMRAMKRAFLGRGR